MTNTISPQERTATEPVEGKGRHVRLLLLWITFALSVACNAVTSFSGTHPLVHLGLGLLTTASGIALLAHYRHRR